MKNILVNSNRIVALSGGIASGKSLVREIFEEFGFYTVSADHMVHMLYENPKVVKELVEISPNSITNNTIDIKKLRTQIIKTPSLLNKLEAILLPKLKILRKQLIGTSGGKTMVYEIPLLHETEQESEFDVIIDLICPKEIRHKRAKVRGMNMHLFEIMDTKQVSDEYRQKHAHFTIDTSAEIDSVRRQIASIIVVNKV